MTEKKETPKTDTPTLSEGKRGTKKLKCSTCGVSVESERVWVAFRCPACGKELITRCEKCKRLENSYTCQSCGFVGP